jgi:hypothetical protein
VINHYKVGKHCTTSITDDAFIFAATGQDRRRGGAGRLLLPPHQR